MYIHMYVYKLYVYVYIRVNVHNTYIRTYVCTVLEPNLFNTGSRIDFDEYMCNRINQVSLTAGCFTTQAEEDQFPCY